MVRPLRVNTTGVAYPPTPALDQTGSPYYEIPLAQIQVGPGVSSIDDGKILDARRFHNAAADHQVIPAKTVGLANRGEAVYWRPAEYPAGANGVEALRVSTTPFDPSYISPLAGVVLGCAARRVPVVLDGLITTAAALVARVVAEAVTACRDWVNTPPADLTPPLFADAVVAAPRDEGGSLDPVELRPVRRAVVSSRGVHGGGDRGALFLGQVNHGETLPRQARPEGLAGHRAEPDRWPGPLRPVRIEPAKTTGGLSADSTKRPTRMPEPPPVLGR